MITEQQLLQHLQEGDRKAQRELYERFAGLAMATAMRYVCNNDDACDVLQDSFVRAFASLDRFAYRGEGSLRAWLLRIVSNQAVNFLRQQARITFTDKLPDDLPDEEPDVGTVPLAVLQRLIASLPTGYRTVFNLYVLEQKSHREIAELLGISEATSSSQLLRAKRMLAKLITDYQKRQQ